ncbi:MAG TPA: DNA replication/repair protein RecF, partial [Geobacteraceae bacterium]
QNAQGKTNLLESIYLLGTMKSFRHAKNTELITWGCATGVVHGLVERQGVTRNIALIINREGKQVRVDRKAVIKLADFFGNLNVVIFSPEEIAMMKGMPEARRRYLDRAVFSGDQSYLAVHHEYTKTLRQRNTLLKSDNRSGLDVWSEKLAQAGARVVGRRRAYLNAIEPLVADFYREIAGSGHTAALTYRPHLLQEDSGEDVALQLLQALERTAGEERRYCTTVVGPHRDDVAFLINGKVVKQHASQGEQRSYVLALKMAEIEYLQRTFSHPPVLLLDDISSELDRERSRNLMEFLKTKEMQVFISTTGLETLPLDGIGDYTTFRVDGGKVLH